MPLSTASAPVFIGSIMSLPDSRAQLGGERTQLVGVERPTDQGHPVELPAGGGHDLRVAVSEVDRGVGGQAIEITPALHVGHPRTLAVGDHDGQREVVVGGVVLGERDLLL